MIKVGIFWVIEGRIWYKLQEKEKIKEGKVDSDLSHYQEWYKGILKLKYKNEDFASFPRGRVIYDSRTSEHIIYAEKICLKEHLNGGNECRYNDYIAGDTHRVGNDLAERGYYCV